MSQIKVGDKVRIKTKEERRNKDNFYSLHGGKVGVKDNFYLLHGGKVGVVRNVRSMDNIYAITVETKDEMLQLNSKGVKKLPEIPEHLFEI